MRKAAIIALMAVGSSLAVYAGINQPKATAEAQTACCDQTECCPADDTKECCENSCE